MSMRMILAPFLALALSPVEGLAQAENPDLKYKAEIGISIQKPPKNEEWGFKDKGLWSNAHMVVSHKVDSINIEILGEAPPDSAGNNAAYWDVKGSIENHWTNISGQAAFKDAKKIEMKASKLPGGGGGNAQAWHLNCTFTLNDTPMEYRAWCFVGKESKVVYIIAMSSDVGIYKKHQKFADYILSTIRCYKRPKS
jgi:hypothetical protein